MGIVLGGFVLAMLAVGFTMLMALPILFIWLAIGVYSEPWAEAAAPAPSDAGLGVTEVEEAERAAGETERPRVMVAGRRGRPL